MIDLQLLRRKAENARQMALKEEDRINRLQLFLYASEYDLTADLLERRGKFLEEERPIIGLCRKLTH